MTFNHGVVSSNLIRETKKNKKEGKVYHMLRIFIKKDNYAYIIIRDNDKLFSLLTRSFTREERRFNNYYRVYETIRRKFYGLINNNSIFKFKAGLVSFLCNSLSRINIDYEVIDERKQLNKNIEICNYLNDNIIIRNYQTEAVNNAFNSSRGIIQLPTGTGKTEVAALVLKTYFKCYPNEAMLYVVPTIDLRKEAVDRFNSYGLITNYKLPIQTGKVNILTYAALVKSQIDYRERNLVGLLIFDEAHHLTAEKSSKIVHKFTNLRMILGMSATPSDDLDVKHYLKDLTSKELILFGSIGNIIYKREIDEAIEDDFIVPIEVHVIEYNSNSTLNDEFDWQTIKDVLLKNKDRADFVAKYTKYIQEKYNLNTIALLIPEIKWSHIYMQEIANIFDDNVRIFELHGGNEIYEYIDKKLVRLTNEKKDEAEAAIRNENINTIFSATTFFFEGINITNIQALINCYGGRGSKRIKQQCGRAMRLFRNKKVAYIHEIKDTHPVLLSQFRRRMTIYTTEYNADIKYINKEWENEYDN